MKKQMLIPFLWGLILPLVVMGILVRLDKRPAQQPEESLETDLQEQIRVVLDDGTTEELELQTYLLRVVLAEMPASFESEALKAQAVVARTYTRKRMEGGKHGQAAVCMDSGCCQGWRSGEDYLAQGGKQSAVEKVRAAVADTDGLVLEDVAREFFVSPNYLSSIIHKETGVTYRQHVIGAKIDVAKKMLDDTRMRVEDIAYAVGYENYVSFYNVFKKVEQMSPSEYRFRNWKEEQGQSR